MSHVSATSQAASAPIEIRARARPELDDPLHVVAVAVLQERRAGALRGDHRLELGGRAAMQSQGVGHGHFRPLESRAPDEGAFGTCLEPPPPLWPGYDEADENDLLALLDRTDSAANDPTTRRSTPRSPPRLATAVASHEALKQEQDPENYRRRLHERGADRRGWRP